MSDDIAKGIAEATNEIKGLVKEQREVQDEAAAKNESFTGEVNATVAKFEEAIQAQEATVKELTAKLESIERVKNALGNDGSDDAAAEYMDTFKSYIKGGLTASEAAKSMNTVTDEDGGFLVPRQMSSRIIELLVEVSPIRQLATVESTSGNSLDIIVEEGTPGATWVHELEDRATGAAAKFGKEQLPVNEMYSFPVLTRNMIDDQDRDLESWLVGRASEDFAQAEGLAFVSGNGIKKPQGLLHGATNGAANVVANGHATVLQADGVIDLTYALQSTYARNGSFLINRASMGEIRKLKDSQNRYLWEPSMQVGQPGTLLGYPVYEAVDMPAIGSGAFPIIFGNIAQTYTVADRRDVSMIRDELTKPGFIKLHISKRVGGQVVDSNAMRILEMAV